MYNIRNTIDKVIKLYFPSQKWARLFNETPTLVSRIVDELEAIGIKDAAEFILGYYCLLISPTNHSDFLVKIEIKERNFSYDKPYLPRLVQPLRAVYEDSLIQITIVPHLKEFLTISNIKDYKKEICDLILDFYRRGWFLWDVKPDNFALDKDRALILADSNAILQSEKMFLVFPDDPYGHSYLKFFDKAFGELFEGTIFDYNILHSASGGVDPQIKSFLEKPSNSTADLGTVVKHRLLTSLPPQLPY